MRTRAEVESALRFAREQHTVAEARYKNADYESGDEHQALGYVHLWAGRIAAYEFVLCLSEPGA